MAMLFEANAALLGFVLYSSLKASVLITLVLLTQRVLARRLSAQGRYLLWLAVVASLVTPIGFTAKIPQLPVLTSLAAKSAQAAAQILPPSTIAESLPYRSMPTHTSMGSAAMQPAYDSTEISIQDALPLTWLSGVLLFMGMVLIKQRRFTKIVRAAVVADAALQNLLDLCRQQTTCRRKVQLLCSPGIDAPLVTGCFRSSLLLPTDLARQLSDAQLRHVFMHELMHVKNYDIATNWLLTLLQAMHWFNPLVWIGFKQLRFDCELARDAATMNHLESGDAQDYGRTLLQLSQPINRRPHIVGALGIVDEHAQLHRRIVMIVQGSLSTRFHSMLTAALFLLFGGIAFSKPVFNVGEPMPAATVAMAAQATVVRAVEVPTEMPPAIAAAAQTVNTVAETMNIAAAPKSKVVRSKRAAIVKNSATAITVAASATAASDESTFIVPAAEPALMVAHAETALTALAQPDINTAVANPETYRDWNAIQELAQAAAEAREPGVRSITLWNKRAETCGVTMWNFTKLNIDYGKEECRELYKTVKDRNQIYSFWKRCDAFIKTYNKLATNFARAQPSQFVNLTAVKNEMLISRQALNEFCNHEVYRKKYPRMIMLIQHSQPSPTSMFITLSNSNPPLDYHSAYPSGVAGM